MKVEIGINGERRIPHQSDTFLEIARVVSQQSNCIRRQYGCVIVKNNQIVSIGYNAAPEGEYSCYHKGFCTRGNEPHNSGYYDNCKSVHAEQAALIQTNPEKLKGATLYLAGYEDEKEIKNVEPCPICMRMIKFAGISDIITN